MQHGLERYKPQIAVALPPHIAPDRFEGAVVTAVNLQPELLRADRTSLFNSAVKAAHDGLIPDGREGAFVIYNTKDGKDEEGRDRWIKKVQWMPMVYGIIKKIRQSGEIATFGARCIYEQEHATGRFSFKFVDGVEVFNHEPIVFGERGPLIGVFAWAKFKDGSTEYEVLNKAEIEKARNVSRAKDSGPWKEWYEEMAKKTAIRKLSKRLPLSADLKRTIEREDELTEFRQIQNQERAAALTAASAQLGQPQPNGNGAAAIIEGEIVDSETGEITNEPSDPDKLTKAAMNGEKEESALDRGTRLLKSCKSEKDISDLNETIKEELAGEEETESWAKARAARIDEIKAAAAEKKPGKK